ncbi:MAG: hypothetical protein KGO96_13895 [Elusimicrobia bacterium]|nr:hypothetical protein [Elusimicrobiota bacterium]
MSRTLAWTPAAGAAVRRVDVPRNAGPWLIQPHAGWVCSSMGPAGVWST